MTKGDAQMLRDHMSRESRKVETYVDGRLSEIEDRLNAIENKLDIEQPSKKRSMKKSA